MVPATIGSVTRPLARLLGALQLVRLSLAVGAVGDLWLAVLLSRADPAFAALPVCRMPLIQALAVAAVVAVGLYAFGASLNDLMDIRHDRAFSPDRPLPAGRIRSGHAVVVTVSSLMVAVIAANFFGQAALLTMVVVAAAILFLNAAGKHFPGVGLLTVGVVHAGHMLIPNQQLTFTLPLWLAMVHAVAVHTAVYRLEEKRPPITGRSVLVLVVGLVAASAVLLARGEWNQETGVTAGRHAAVLAFPILAVAGFVVVARWKSRSSPAASAAEKLLRYGSLWQVVYGVAWMAALGQWQGAWWLALLALAGFAVMTMLRELVSLVLRPPMYRA